MNLAIATESRIRTVLEMINFQRRPFRTPR